MTTTIKTRLRQLFSTLAAITAVNPILLEGEVWIEKNPATGRSTGRRKVGDGVLSGGIITAGTAFNDLPFEPGGGDGGSGDVVGPSISTDGRAALFDGTTGKLLKQSEAAPVVSNPVGITGADAVSNIVSLTQAEYDAIATPNAATLYVITD